jgi:hypothetical protein
MMVKIVFIVLCVVLSSGCAFFASTPHDNFIGHLKAQVGKIADDVPYYQFPHNNDLVDDLQQVWKVVSYSLTTKAGILSLSRT